MNVTKGLHAPATYRKATITLVEEMTNGCGAAGAKFDFVPDRIYGLRITEACRIHDWMYMEGIDIEDKDKADRSFLNNLLRLIYLRSANKFTRFLRNRRAVKYFEAVQNLGGPAFWAGKEDV